MSIPPIIGNDNLRTAGSSDRFKAGDPAAGGFGQKSTTLRETIELLGIDHYRVTAPNFSENSLGVLVVTEEGKSSIFRPGTRPVLNEPEKIPCSQAKLLKRNIGTDQVAHAAGSKHKL